MSGPLDALEVLRRGRWVDLTHAFHPGIPHSPLFEPEQRTLRYDCVTADDLARWEARNGPVREGSFVALRTGWSRRWPSQERMLNTDGEGVHHTPGWSLEVLTVLFEERAAAACGHETLDTDPGVVTSAGRAPLERYVLAGDRWQIELLTGFDQVPESGAVIVASWPKVKDGSGFPARVFAICP